MALSNYATDGLCHNAEPGIYDHECGKPATWIGVDKSGWACGFCDDCKEHGAERHGKRWVRRADWCDAPGRRAGDDACGGLAQTGKALRAARGGSKTRTAAHLLGRIGHE